MCIYIFCCLGQKIGPETVYKLVLPLFEEENLSIHPNKHVHSFVAVL